MWKNKGRSYSRPISRVKNLSETTDKPVNWPPYKLCHHRLAPPPSLPLPPSSPGWWIRCGRGSAIVNMISWKGWISPSAKTQLRRKVTCRVEVRIYRNIEEILTLWIFSGFYCPQDQVCIKPCPQGAYCVRDKLVNATVSFLHDLIHDRVSGTVLSWLVRWTLGREVRHWLGLWAKQFNFTVFLPPRSVIC